MLDLVDGNRMFMQGYSTLDLKDNLVRVLDIIRGIRLDDAIGRIFNLKKLYPQLPKCFNDILLHFSAGAQVLYDSASEFHDDLARSIEEVFR